MSVTTFLKSVFNNPAARSLGIYTATNFFAKAVSFFLLFIFTNPLYITPAENGLLSLFSTSLLFLMPFLSMGVVHSVSADYYKLGKEEFKNFFTTSFIIPVIVMILSFVVLYMLRDFLYGQFGFPVLFVWMIPLVTFLIFCNEQLLSMARNNNEPAVYFRANMGKTILELGVSVLLVVVLAYHWKGRVAGVFISFLILAIYAAYYFHKKNYLFGKIEKKYIRSELIYAVPIIALQAGIFSMNASDKFFLSHFTSDNNETVGVYSIACVFASIVNVLSMALLQYFFPRIFTILSKDRIDYLAIKKLFLYYAGILSAGLIVAAVLTPFLYKFFINQCYHEALHYYLFLFVAAFLWGISYFFYAFILFHKQKKIILALSLCCIAVSLYCNYYFIRSGNAVDAASGVCLSYSIVFVLSLLFTYSHWKYFFTSKKSR